MGTAEKMKLLNLAFLTAFHFTNSLPQYPDRPLIRVYEDDSSHEWSIEEPRFTDDRTAFQISEDDLVDRHHSLVDRSRRSLRSERKHRRSKKERRRKEKDRRNRRRKRNK